MNRRNIPPFLLFCVAVGVSLSPVTSPAHNVPIPLPAPRSEGEAWNVIEESAANIDRLLELRLPREAIFQMANIGVAMVELKILSAKYADIETISKLVDTLTTDGFQVVLASRDKDEPIGKTREQWDHYRKVLKALESRFPPEVVHSVVYICPMHPNDRQLSKYEKCSVCGMSLVRRHLPASAVYEKPGEPTLKLEVAADPLVVGKPAEVKIRLSQRDGSPVMRGDLIEMHTQPIHLLINDASLSDYHHEHPKPTEIRGEYAFSFMPRRPGRYRIWADVVPAATGVQEYVIGDLPAATMPAPLSDRQTVLTTIVEGRKYQLAFIDNGRPIRAGQTVVGTISVTGPDGKPFANLEPVMGAFAHIVGFSEDGKTVIHIHPYGRDPTAETDRAGPAFAFKLYAPSPGFLRLYGQVQIGGVSQFVPFGITILPADTPTTLPTLTPTTKSAN